MEDPAKIFLRSERIYSVTIFGIAPNLKIVNHVVMVQRKFTEIKKRKDFCFFFFFLFFLFLFFFFTVTCRSRRIPPTPRRGIASRIERSHHRQLRSDNRLCSVSGARSLSTTIESTGQLTSAGKLHLPHVNVSAVNIRHLLVRMLER